MTADFVICSAKPLKLSVHIIYELHKEFALSSSLSSSHLHEVHSCCNTYGDKVHSRTSAQLLVSLRDCRQIPVRLLPRYPGLSV